MNDFYKQPQILQWIEATLLLIIGFLPALAIIEKGYSQPIFYLLFILYVPVGQFAFTPLFRLIGVYKYYSPMLLGYIGLQGKIYSRHPISHLGKKWFAFTLLKPQSISALLKKINDEIYLKP